MFENVKELLKPIGDYKVGVKRFDFVDESRVHVFPFEEENARRKIPVIIYYPSDDVDNQETAPYMSKEEAKQISKNYFYLYPRNLYKIKTHLYEDVLISNKKDNYPLILYNHGYGAYMQNNTILLSSLASLGYIVVSIGHPYEARIIKYLDDSTVRIHPYNRQLLKLTKEAKEKAKRLYQRKPKSENDFLEFEKEYNSLFNSELHKHVQIWVDDSSFIADIMKKLNKGEIKSIFKDKLNFDNGIGIIGHSFGGSTAGQACWKNIQFSCGVNIDCGTFGEYGSQDIKKPFMSIGSNYINLVGRSVFFKNSNDSYMVLIDKTAHLGYTDALFTARLLNIFNRLGKRDKYEFYNIFSEYIIKFFDKYLKQKKLVNLGDSTYDGVKFSKN